MTDQIIAQLIEAQLDFMEREFLEVETIKNELINFYDWFKIQKLGDIWTEQQIVNLVHSQILHTDVSDFFIDQIVHHIQIALHHPLNDTTTIEDIFPVLTIDHIAQYVASKSQHRQALIRQLTHHPSFSKIITQLIQHAIQDYVSNMVGHTKIIGVSRFMKMGKSVLESVTESNLDETISNYLEKNIVKLTQLSEIVLSQHFSDEQFYHFQANLWHKVKKQPISLLRDYIESEDLPQTVGLGHDLWTHLRQSDYLRQQIQDGIGAWYNRNKERCFELILRDLNIERDLIQKELSELLNLIAQKVISSGYLRQRAKLYLEKFYYSENVHSIFKE